MAHFAQPGKLHTESLWQAVRSCFKLLHACRCNWPLDTVATVSQETLAAAAAQLGSQAAGLAGSVRAPDCQPRCCVADTIYTVLSDHASYNSFTVQDI